MEQILSFCLSIMHYVALLCIIKPQPCMNFMATINSMCIIELLKLYPSYNGLVPALISTVLWLMAWGFVKWSQYGCKLIQAQKDKKKTSDRGRINKLNKIITDGCVLCNCNNLRRIAAIHIIWAFMLSALFTYGFLK